MINIIGAGLGGLLLAQGLKKRGIACRVFERDESARSREQGYRISLLELGRRALEELLPRERYRRLLGLQTRGVGRDFHFARGPEQPLLRLSADAWTICRPALRELLLEDVDVTWGHRLRSLDDVPPGELVVGADGAGSAVREALRSRGVPVPELASLGVHTLAGYTRRTPAWDRRLPLNRAGAVQYLGPAGQTLFVSFCESQQKEPFILWALSQRASFSEPHPQWHGTLLSLMRESVRTLREEELRTSRVRVPNRRLHPGITLLGDAAHAMPPQRGLGGNHAFEDARQLVGKLDDIAGYEREMFTRGKRAVEESEEACQLLHFRNPLARAARNGLLRGLSLLHRPALPKLAHGSASSPENA